jgi:acetyl esterase/lipase
MYLPYECFEPPRQGADAITRKLHETLPLSVQREIRDKHITGFFDVGAYVLSLVLAMKHPSTLPRFIALSRSGTTYQYGLEAHQVVEVYRCGQEEAPVLVFVHGGA